ncbi:hypothetical protein RJ640_016324 [Escallonia rubra]|uniref:Vacuolar protein sorting-associated protein 54 C-terminal domain-containing protein n=1 Tax=Escallonia rubra TaxID=112253 RepID=A0AA88USJ7_9ASTE|nr:hypothetical protein RJ640_016324 [Escallonia rubra]
MAAIWWKVVVVVRQWLSCERNQRPWCLRARDGGGGGGYGGGGGGFGGRFVRGSAMATNTGKNVELIASADCAGALDVTDDLQHLLDGDELTGLHCFRHLRDHVAAAIDSINSILSAEFMRASIQGAGHMDAAIVSKSKARATLLTHEKYDEITLDEEETSNFRDRLLPLIIGLLRTAKLPAVLRIYRDTLTADMKTAIKTTVAELLPILVARPLESDYMPGERTVDADGGSSSLASKLRSLSSESFVQLLGAIFKIVLAHLVRAAEVKKAIEWIMCNLDGHYAADSVAAAIAVGAIAAETAHETDGQVPIFLPYSPQRNATNVPSLHGNGNDATSPSNMSKNFRADVLRENTEAVFAACDAAHGRWAKLLGVRALLHPRLRLPEFLSIFNISQEFITATEKIGGRLGYSIRGTLQSQAKAFVDFQHESRMAKTKAILDQETWVEVDVPDEFQAIVTSLFCSEPLSTGMLDDSPSSTIACGSKVTSSNDASAITNSVVSSSKQHVEQTDFNEAPADSMAQVKLTSSSRPTNNGDVNAITLLPQANNKDRGKTSSQMLFFNGVGYHMMMSEYIDMSNFLPALSSEVIHRVVEILKFFNTRTCQLVLGAGAMQQFLYVPVYATVHKL